jgi:hypothetical protein
MGDRYSFFLSERAAIHVTGVQDARLTLRSGTWQQYTGYMARLISQSVACFPHDGRKQTYMSNIDRRFQRLRSSSN